MTTNASFRRAKGPSRSPGPLLGIEGGGTRTVALLASPEGRELRRLEAGPANLKLLTDAELAEHFRSLAGAFPPPATLGIGLAGALDEGDRQRIRSAAAQVWPGVPCAAASDLETALRAAAESRPRKEAVRVLIVCGTGSACYGQADGAPEVVKVGGWGHLLGDRASGYEIGLRALRESMAAYDETGAWPPLGARLLRALQLNEPGELVDWAQRADKADIAALTPEVFAAWEQGDGLGGVIISGAAKQLARDAATCAGRLAVNGQTVEFVMSGGVLLKQPRFRAAVRRELRRRWPGARICLLARESAWGAVALAREASAQSSQGLANVPPPAPAVPRPRSSRLSPTEQRNRRSLKLDKMALREAIALMLSEEAKVPRCLLRQAPRLERVVRAIVRAFRRGGRLFYVGAGTSGRLGVLDASECPPTFSTPPEQVQGIIAGGATALWQGVEGAEDDAAAGQRAMGLRNVQARDVVVGIAASGTTPFVWGALHAAAQRRAFTVLLCFNPYLKIPKDCRPSVVLAPELGPEVLTGSTRLKAGTATKLVLNLFSTLAMVGLGKVRSNLMVDVKPSNEKLRARALRIVRELTSKSEAESLAALQAAEWNVKGALRRLGRG